MNNILLKELKLSSSPLAFAFIVFGLMFLLPGYPILCGAFFVTLGIFQSFQTAREANDIVFSALLPIAKRDVVKGKFIFVCFIEGCGFVLMFISTVVRMTALVDAGPYRVNALMNANFFALGMALIIFGLFNLVFLGEFFKTAYKQGSPFIAYIIAAFAAISVAEALHHFKGLEALNAFGTDYLGMQLAMLAAGSVAFILLTVLSFNKSCDNFEKINL